MQNSGILAALEALQKKTNEEWLTSLEPRKLEELSFHDTQYGHECHARNDCRKYYSAAQAANDYVDQWIKKNLRGKVFLDYACGSGGWTIRAAQAGAELAIGLDISGSSIQYARKRAEELGCTNTFFVQGDCENTGLPSNSVDAILCSGMLHHLDLSYAIPELRRILKPGGRCLASEALNYNPAIKLYRRLTPELRTTWEKQHILSLKDVRFIERFLKVENIRYWTLCTLLATPFRKTPLFRPALAICNLADSVALKIWPIKLMAWMFTFEITKPL